MFLLFKCQRWIHSMGFSTMAGSGIWPFFVDWCGMSGYLTAGCGMQEFNRGRDGTIFLRRDVGLACFSRRYAKSNSLGGIGIGLIIHRDSEWNLKFHYFSSHLIFLVSTIPCGIALPSIYRKLQCIAFYLQKTTMHYLQYMFAQYILVTIKLQNRSSSSIKLRVST